VRAASFSLPVVCKVRAACYTWGAVAAAAAVDVTGGLALAPLGAAARVRPGDADDDESDDDDKVDGAGAEACTEAWADGTGATSGQ
jgi:hypothetical protein